MKDMVTHDLATQSSRNDKQQEAAKRIFRLLQLLLANECARSEVFQKLADFYNIDKDQVRPSRSTEKMFERDIQFLKQQGFEIKRTRASDRSMRYSLVKGSGPNAPFLFTTQEVDSLALLYNLFADANRYMPPGTTSQFLPQQAPLHPFASDILLLIEKFAASLPASQKKQFERWIRKPYLYFNLTTVAEYLPHRMTIDQLIHAIDQRQQVHFIYTSLRQEPLLHEKIDPYYITNMEGHFYLIAYSHASNNFLEFRIDRFQADSLKIGPTTIDVERRRHPIKFQFWLDGSIAKRGLSQRWLTQTKEDNEETYLDEQGKTRQRVLISATTYNEWRVVQQLLKYGDKVELVNPPHLREQMKKEVSRMYQMYTKG